LLVIFLYWHAFHILSSLRFKGDIDSVCEVGGGYGNPALQWLTNPVKPVGRICIVDMPEVLFFAEVFSAHGAAESKTPLCYGT